MDEFPSMNRRQLLITTGMGAVTALSGCLGDDSPPPRKSNLIKEITLNDGSLTLDLVSDKWVMARTEYVQGQSVVWGANPIGVASAKGKGGSGGRGFTGRGSGGHSSAPRTNNGFIWYHGGDYTDDWYDSHSDEIKKYSVTINSLVLAYIGSNNRMEDTRPGPGVGDITWHAETDNITDPVTFMPETIDQQGWYRVGAQIVGENNDADFDWECYDFRLTGSSGSDRSINEKWKISPRI